MNELLKQLSSGVLRLYDAQGTILAVAVLPEDVIASATEEVVVLRDITLKVYRSGLAYYGLIQMASGKLTPKLPCGIAGSGAPLLLLDVCVVADTTIVLPGPTFVSSQEEFNRQLAAILEKVIKPKVSANVQVIRAADKVKKNG